MRRALAIAIGLSFGIVIGAVGPGTLAMLDTRYRSLGDAVLFTPSSVGANGTAHALVLALPSLGGTGRGVADALAAAAEAHGWLVLAPSPQYEKAGEPMASSDQRVDYELIRLLNLATEDAPHPARTRIFVIGTSRGAQSAHRFALRHPDRVAAVASMSAGSYTMPTSDAIYPLGVGAFEVWNDGRPFDAQAVRSVRFLVGVGADDLSRDAVPADWDAVGGFTRVDRARRFADALTSLAIPNRLAVFPGVGHALTPDMIGAAVDWFGSQPAQ